MASIRASSACQQCLRHLRPSLSTITFRPALYTTAGARSQSLFANSKKDLPVPPLEAAAGNASVASSYAIPREIGPGVLEGMNTRVLLRQDNLFHPMDQSPSAAIRERAARIKSTAYCPHPEHKHAANPSHIKFTCPDCGVPTYCSEAHWAEDYENHLLICDTLKESNEDEHDLRSGRFFPEFEYPGEQIEEQLINMTNWDTLLYTRNSHAVDDDRQQRQLTKLLTYPATIASFLHELSPYSLRHRLTAEGLRSLSGILPPSSPLPPADPQPSATPSIPPQPAAEKK